MFMCCNFIAVLTGRGFAGIVFYNKINLKHELCTICMLFADCKKLFANTVFQKSSRSYFSYNYVDPEPILIVFSIVTQ